MKKFFVLISAVVCLGLTGCAKNDAAQHSDDSEAKETTTFKGKDVVDASYVKKHEKDSILIDARGEEAAKKETIASAVPLDWQSLADVTSGASGDEHWGLVLPPKELAEKLGDKGIDKNKEILLFAAAQDGWGEDGRIAWELKAAGYEDVKLVDGGFNALKEAGMDTNKSGKTLKPVTVNIDSINQDHRITTDTLKADYDSYKVVDVRTDKEYDGAILYGEAKGGHLPDAIPLDFTKLFNKNGTLKDNKTLTKLFEDAGLSKEDKIVTYCTAGIRSAYMQEIMEMCGFHQVKNYDGSYYRWAKIEDVEK